MLQQGGHLPQLKHENQKGGRGSFWALWAVQAGAWKGKPTFLRLRSRDGSLRGPVLKTRKRLPFSECCAQTWSIPRLAPQPTTSPALPLLCAPSDFFTDALPSLSSHWLFNQAASIQSYLDHFPFLFPINQPPLNSGLTWTTGNFNIFP